MRRFCCLMILLFLGFGDLSFHRPIVALAQNNQPLPQCTNLVRNGGFEEGEAPGSYRPLDPGNTSIVGWRVIQGQIDYVGGDHASSRSARHVDLDGTPGFGGIEQSFSTQPGKKYTLGFDFAGNPGAGPRVKTLSVRIGDVSRVLTHGADLNWTPQTIEFTATSSQTTLQFASLDREGGYAGPIVDNVYVIAKDTHSENSFNGEWTTNWGPMQMTISGGSLTGQYTHDNGRVQGQVSYDGKSARGLWSESPSYQGPNDAGRFEFTLSEDGSRFSGKWGYGESLNNGDWTGTRKNIQACAPPRFDKAETSPQIKEVQAGPSF